MSIISDLSLSVFKGHVLRQEHQPPLFLTVALLSLGHPSHHYHSCICKTEPVAFSPCLISFSGSGVPMTCPSFPDSFGYSQFLPLCCSTSTRYLSTHLAERESPFLPSYLSLNILSFLPEALSVFQRGLLSSGLL